MARGLGVLDEPETPGAKGKKVGPLHVGDAVRSTCWRQCLPAHARSIWLHGFRYGRESGYQCVAVCGQTKRAGSGGSSEEELAPGDEARAKLSCGALRELEQLQVRPSSLCCSVA